MNNNIYNNEAINGELPGYNINYVYNIKNPQNKNNIGIPTYNYQFNNNINYNYKENNYYASKNNINNIPKNMINYGYQINNEITNDNDKKEYYKESNGGLVKSYAFYEYQNIKKKDYIEFKSIENLNGDQNKLLFCLFNGHGGHEVSKFLQDYFAIYMKKLFPFKNITQDISKLFNILDEKILQLNVPNVGATATIVYIESINGKRRLNCVNVGNNKCLLINKKGIWKISNEHRIDDPEEHKRIIRKGGIINIEQCFGKLSSSRSLGDWSFKKYGGIISEPHISIIDINDEDLYLIIGAEKIWKYVKDEECLKLVNLNKDPLEICKKISIDLLNRGCSYNIGSVVIKFK